MVSVQIGTRDVTIHMLVAEKVLHIGTKKVSHIGTKQHNFVENLILVEKINMEKKYLSVRLGC